MKHLLSVADLTAESATELLDEADRFEARSYADDAVRLRRLEDDHGKLTGVDVPPLSQFRPLLDRLETRVRRP